MFNSELKKEWLNRLERIQDEYKVEMNEAQEATLELFENRKNAALIVKQVEDFVNSIAKTPKEYNVALEKINFKMHDFNSVISLKNESDLAMKISGSTAGAGALAGAGVAALGPTAAMAIATTFGTASTGASIATLSGAAATNAALAWLGGGALAAGGGGMVAGKSLLALAGPIGWAIGGASILGGALFASSKNKKIAKEAEENVYKIKEQINYIVKTKTEILACSRLTEEHSRSLKDQLNMVKDMVNKSLIYKEKSNRTFFEGIKKFLFKPFKNEVAVTSGNGMKPSYTDFDSDLKKELGALVNNTLALASLIEKKLG